MMDDIDVGSIFATRETQNRDGIQSDDYIPRDNFSTTEIRTLEYDRISNDNYPEVIHK